MAGTKDVSTIAAIRYGYGLSPDQPAPVNAQALLDQLDAPDTAATLWPLSGTDFMRQQMRDMQGARKAKRAGDETGQKRIKAVRKRLNNQVLIGLRAQLARASLSPQGFRERLQFFWCDHFTVTSKSGVTATAPDAFAQEAIRPHLATTFAQMLRAAVTHPAMLLYLDQTRSIGPQSAYAKKRENVGLNENLGREVLELHTLGVDAPYTQEDVRQFAKLLTGLGFNAGKGFVFHPNWAQPGAELVLGQRYGGETPANISDIYAALDDIALHPATAHHLAHKLAVHFVADQPDPDLVDHIASAYLAHQSDLRATYAAMLEHPAAWAPLGGKARQPWDFMAASLRAIAPPAGLIADLDQKKTRSWIIAPLRAMGQPYQKPLGPNGWAEEASAWITPQGLATRISWAMRIAALYDRHLPDPRDFVQSALGAAASPTLIQAAARAESKSEGIGLILASADFNRR
ncbi:DUF1800 domain-containing protein [Thioclava indica]|uniref:DUF1800 domain-containing protein n=1 Tax=Thioclava indica TaxID=1353528 RepID=A0A074KGJ0_9RHOB|nr:DUF1800 domain-containing protein [Thioclava indica]KEO60637.1 hypothetical protein DT23_13025 [Thioclava indica]